jgi:hypothetical protein
MRIALPTAAIVGVALIGCGALGGPDTGADSQGSTRSASAEPSAAMALPDLGPLSPGSYLIGHPFPVQVSMTLGGEHWGIWAPVSPDVAAVYQETPTSPDGRGIVVVVVESLPIDPCDHSSAMLDPPVGPTVDDLASALAGQPSTEASEPTDITLDGYSGTYLEYSMTGITEDCPGGLIRWQTSQGPRMAIAGEHDQVWILDVDGVRLVIDAFSFTGTPEAALTELRQIVESMQIEPPSGS